MLLNHGYIVWCLISILNSALHSSLANVEGPIVNTMLGQVRGVHAADGDYISFLGIPFARVDPSNPFGDPQPHPQYDGIFEATDDSSICPQQEEFNNTIVGSIDCLHLNVFVPSSASPTNRMAVLVSIFGGGFIYGFYGRYLYGPKFLVRHDVVVVAMNYRVGPYGFMCTDTPLVPGNAGLKDQLMALRWIRDNIAEFGGDPDNVTVGGISAGGMATDLQVLRNIDDQIPFHKVILQSGTAQLAIPTSFRDGPLRLSQELGFQSTNISEQIAFLAAVDPHLLIETSLRINLPIGICIENIFEGIEPFVTENWLNLTVIPGLKDMPILLGYTNKESRPSADEGVEDPHLVYNSLNGHFIADHKDFNGIVDIVRHFYFGDEEIDMDAIEKVGDFLSDLGIGFSYNTHRSLAQYLENNPGNIYLYQFSVSGERNFVKQRYNYTFEGASHADDTGYLFDVSYMNEPSSEDQKAIDQMTTLWTNFAKYGDPTPETSELLPYKWEPVTRGSPQHYMEIDYQLSVGTRPDNERTTFLDLLYEMNDHLLRTHQT